METNVRRRKNSWGVVFADILVTLFNAIVSVRFVMTFIIFVLVGGVGIWFPWFLRDDESLVLLNSQSLFTFSLTVLGMLLMEWGIDKGRTTDKAAVGICLGVVSLILCLIGIFTVRTEFDVKTLVGACLSLLLFVFANANHQKYDSDSDEVLATSTGYHDANFQNLKEGEE